MTDVYYSAQNAECEIVINRSRFIGKIFGIKNEDEALQKLKELKKEYSDATHICYGYVFDTEGFAARYSDAGEPAGTAGQPILEAIKKRNLRLVLVAVVRYYGGIKLGAGGLTRAYGECALKAINNAKQLIFRLCNVYNFRADFSLYQKINKSLPQEVQTINVEYGQDVFIEIAAPISVNFEDFMQNISLGQIKPALTDTRYIEFK